MMFFPPGLPQEVAINYFKFLEKSRKEEEERKAKQKMEQLFKERPPKTFGDLMSYGMYMSSLKF